MNTMNQVVQVKNNTPQMAVLAAYIEGMMLQKINMRKYFKIFLVYEKNIQVKMRL